MSMGIDFSKPLTDEERAYLNERGRYADIERADNMYGTTNDPGTGDGTGPVVTPLGTAEQRALEKERLQKRLAELESEEDAGTGDADDEVEPYEAWTPDTLKAEIDRRNALLGEGEEKLSKSGSKQVLADRLYADDEKAAAAQS